MQDKPLEKIRHNMLHSLLGIILRSGKAANGKKVSCYCFFYFVSEVTEVERKFRKKIMLVELLLISWALNVRVKMIL